MENGAETGPAANPGFAGAGSGACSRCGEGCHRGLAVLSHGRAPRSLEQGLTSPGRFLLLLKQCQNLTLYHKTHEGKRSG